MGYEAKVRVNDDVIKRKYNKKFSNSLEEIHFKEKQ